MPHGLGKRQGLPQVPGIAQSDLSMTWYGSGWESATVNPHPYHPHFCLIKFAKGVSFNSYQTRGVELLTHTIYLWTPTFNSLIQPEKWQIHSWDYTFLFGQKWWDLLPRTCAFKDILHPPKHKKDVQNLDIPADFRATVQLHFKMYEPLTDFCWLRIY